MLTLPDDEIMKNSIMTKHIRKALDSLAHAVAVIFRTEEDDSGVTYYTFELSYMFSSEDDVSSIEAALGNIHHNQYVTKGKAKKDWRSFLSAVKDGDVHFAKESSYCTVSLVQKAMEDGYLVTRKTLDSVTWDKNGRHRH